MGIPAHLLPHTVTRVRPAEGTDAYNNTTRSYGNDADRADVAAWLQQDQRSEPRDSGRDADVQLWLLMTNEGDIVTTDRVEWGEVVFDVDGAPEPVYTPAGLHHYETRLRVVTG